MTTGVFDTPGQLDLWVAYMSACESGDEDARQTAVTNLIDSFLSAGFTATCDFPVALIYKDLMKRFPDAVVVLSLRSDGHAWARSVMQTIGRVHGYMGRLPFRLFAWHRKFHRLSKFLWESMPAVELDEEGEILPETLPVGYERWNEEVIRSVPKEKLLVFHAKDGWKPLCDRMKKQIPNKPYPHVNSSAEFKAFLDRFQKIVDYWWILPAAVTAAGAVAAMAVMKQK